MLPSNHKTKFEYIFLCKKFCNPKNTIGLFLSLLLSLAYILFNTEKLLSTEVEVTVVTIGLVNFDNSGRQILKLFSYNIATCDREF